MKAIWALLGITFASSTASAQAWNQHNLDVTPLCGGSGTIFDWTLEYEMSVSEVICMGGCDTTAYVDVWDYNAGGTDRLLCTVMVQVSADDGTGTCFTPVLYGTGSFSCDLSAAYGGAEGNELELYYVMEPEIPGACGNPYWSSNTLALPECGSSGGNGTGQVNCTGTSCSSTPSPLPDFTYAYNYWDPCGGQSYTWSASADFELHRDRACIGGDATEGVTGGCTGGVEISGSGTWQGTGTGLMLVSVATDGTIQSTGLTSLTAVCQTAATASIDCFGTSCSTSPTPLPDGATATTDWDPCAGAAFDWTATGSFESGSDRFCVGGTATPGLGGGCGTGTELSGNGPFSGTAAGRITLSLATDGSQTSPGLGSLSATCQGTTTTAEVRCTGLRCVTTPAPLPDDATASTRWDPCAGGTFSFSATADLESGYDRVCVGGVATAGPSGGCTGGTELTGQGPFLGNATGAVTVSVATDASTPSPGLTELVAVCVNGPPPVNTASFRCAGATCTTNPTPLPDDATGSSTWNPCAGAGFNWSATGQMEDGIDRGCVGGIATAGTTGSCSAGTELTGSGPWSGQSSGPAMISFATDDSVPSQGLTLQMTSCAAPTTGVGVDLVATLGGIIDEARPGRKLRIEYDVANSGSATAPTTATAIRLVPDGAGDGYDLCRDRVEGLAPSAMASRSLECLIPSDVEAGFWQLELTVDGDNLLSELSEANNKVRKGITILGEDVAKVPPPAEAGGCTCVIAKRETVSAWILLGVVAMVLGRRRTSR